MLISLFLAITSQVSTMVLFSTMRALSYNATVGQICHGTPYKISPGLKLAESETLSTKCSSLCAVGMASGAFRKKTLGRGFSQATDLYPRSTQIISGAGLEITRL